MTDALSDLSRDAMSRAASRLNQIGVFADEERMFPSVSTLRRGLAELRAILRSNGYTGGDLAIEEVDRAREGVTFLIYDRTKLGSTPSAELRWYQDYRDRWHRRVEERVKDWIDRLNKLKTTIQNWLPAGMSIADRPPTKMNEELMRSFNVPPANMPTFEILREVDKVMRVQPKGLWIIGANGRVDLLTANGSWILVDQSEPLSGTSDWHYYAGDNRRRSTKFDQAQLLGLLR